MSAVCRNLRSSARRASPTAGSRCRTRAPRSSTQSSGSRTTARSSGAPLRGPGPTSSRSTRCASTRSTSTATAHSPTSASRNSKPSRGTSTVAIPTTSPHESTRSRASPTRSSRTSSFFAMARPQPVAPMLAVTRARPSGPAWAWEMKWDGVRAIATYGDGEVELFNRRVLPVTHRYPELVRGDALGEHSLVLDGEIVATDDSGRPSFQRLQARMHLDDRRQIAELTASVPASFMVFDLLHLDGDSLVDEPYTVRRAALASLASHGLPPGWHAPAHSVADPAPMWDIAEQFGLEGIVAKRLDARYEPGRRSANWIKV